MGYLQQAPSGRTSPTVACGIDRTARVGASRRIARRAGWWFGLWLAILAGLNPARADEVTIFAAASTTTAITAIAERFVVLAEEQFSSKNYGRAQAYITLGLQVDPDNRGLETLRSMIETREKTFFENLTDYFKSG